MNKTKPHFDARHESYRRNVTFQKVLYYFNDVCNTGDGQNAVSRPQPEAVASMANKTGAYNARKITSKVFLKLEHIMPKDLVLFISFHLFQANSLAVIFIR